MPANSPASWLDSLHSPLLAGVMRLKKYLGFKRFSNLPLGLVLKH